MTFAETWLHSPAALSIAEALLHSLWQGAVLALVMAASFRFIRTSRLRYAAACAALVITAAASLATLVYIGSSSADRPSTHAMPHPGAAGANGDAGVARSAGSPAVLLQRALPWITPAWILGVLLLNFRQAASWMAARRLRRRGVCPAPDLWQQRLDAVRSRLKIAKPVVLLESCLTHAPLVVGHIRPVILAPVGVLAALPVEQVELILMHELAHIRRCDYLVNIFQTLIENAMFYNPGVWAISRAIRSEREHCCDDVVVAAAGGPALYAAALTALEQNRTQNIEAAIAATGGSLVKRIRRLLHQPELPASMVTPIFAALILIAVAGGLLFAARPPQAAEDAYKRWLDEDVPYIITDQERAGFLALSTDLERAAFIDQFWQRRDPTPGSATNEYKDEHYGRIGYANSRFGMQLPFTPGWKTDRGRIYIMYGKPDEIESHPAGGTYVRPVEQGGSVISTFPFEMWRYRYIQGIGNQVLLEFVDSSLSGEYRMTVDPAAKRRLEAAPPRQR